MTTNPIRFFSFHSPERIAVSSFEELRHVTELHYEYDRIFYKLRPYTNLLSLYNIPWSIVMPNRGMQRYPSDWKFVSIALSSADERNFTEWYARERDNFVAMLEDLMASTYKLSLSYDFDNTCFIATISGTKSSSVNSNSSISARSDEFLEAVCLVLYKHYVMCEGGDWSEHARPSNWG